MHSKSDCHDNLVSRYIMNVLVDFSNFFRKIKIQVRTFKHVHPQLKVSFDRNFRSFKTRINIVLFSVSVGGVRG